MNNPLTFPREINPSLIEKGDKIRVTLPEDKGIVNIKIGVVFHIHQHGSTRYLMTDEGATLVAWEPSRKSVKIELLDRPIFEQAPLWSDELERESA
jgi:hypothetical protein